MSLFDQLTDTVTHLIANPEQGSQLLSAVLELLNKPEIGGISGLLRRFQEQGLGDIISSWISTGQNLPISADQIKQVIDGDSLQRIAETTGLPLQNIAAEISNFLPTIIDHLTPDGTVPEQSNLLAQGLDLLKGKLFS